MRTLEDLAKDRLHMQLLRNIVARGPFVPTVYQKFCKPITAADIARFNAQLQELEGRV